MARLSITRETIQALFAKSGNVCAFPGCNHELVTARNIFVGQICHIEAANPGGQRYNIRSTDEYRRSNENLVLLCYRHHKETDDASSFDVESLKAIKGQHESRFGQNPFKVNEAFIYRLETEMDTYWFSLSEGNKNNHFFPQFAVPVPVGLPAELQFTELYSAVKRIHELAGELADRDEVLNEEIRTHIASLGYDLKTYDAVPYYKNPFFNRNCETHCLAVNNSFADLFVALKQAEVRFLEEYVKTHSTEISMLERFTQAKSELHNMAVSTGYAD